MTVLTEEIVFEYVRSYVDEHGSSRDRQQRLVAFREATDRVNLNAHVDYKREVCEALTQLSGELREFILNDHQEKFNEMLNTVGSSNPTYQDFATIADELLSDGVSWYKIVTFLTFGAELVCRTIDNHASIKRSKRAAARKQRHNSRHSNLENNEEDTENNRVDEERVEEQPEESLDQSNRDSVDQMTVHTIKSLTRYIDENLMQWISKQQDGWLSIKQYTLDAGYTKGMRYYFRMATLAAFVGGLYFCSKFILQK